MQGGDNLEERSKMQSNLTIETPLKVIHDAGGRLVLCRAKDEWIGGELKKAKSPIRGAWQRRRPSVDECMTHDGLLGLVPFSLNLTALDVDHGDWRRMPECFAHYATRRKGGRHLWYSDNQARGNSTWTAEDCSGEVRGARGYAIQWNDGIPRIADALTGPRQRRLFPFPADLLTQTKLLQSPHKAVYIPGQSLELERVLKGERHKCYFEVMRLWAYREVNKHRDRTQAQWSAAVLTAAQANNQRFPDPLKPWEVRIMASSVAEWTWANYYDHSPERQRERQAKWAEVVQEKNRDRNRSITESSESNAALSALHGLSVRTIQRIRR